MLVVALLPDPVKRARVTEAMRGVAVVQFCDTVIELQCLLRRPRVAGAIVAPASRDGEALAPAVRALKEDMPRLPVVAYFGVEDDLSADVVAMVKAGVDGTLFFGTFDSTHVIRRSFEASRTACAAAFGMQGLEPHIPKRLLAVAEYCLTHAIRTLPVEEVARAHGIHRKTLTNHFLQECGMPPSTFIGWCRLLTVADALLESDQSIEQIAMALEFPSAGALRGMFKRYLNIRPRQLRALGGPRYVMSQLVRAIELGRAAQQGGHALDARRELMAG